MNAIPLVHTLAGFLLARPTGPTREDFEESQQLYEQVLGTPAAKAHPDFADAAFNLGVIQHFRATAGSAAAEAGK